MRPIHFAGVLTAVLVWGFNFSIAKIGLEQIPPILMMALRFILVAILLAPFLRVQPGRMGQIAALSFTLGGLHFSLMFAGLRGVDAGPAAIAAQLYVPFSVLLARLVFGERLNLWQVLGMAVAFAGVYLLAGEPRIAPRPWYLLMVVAAAFVMAVATMQIKKLGPINVFTLNAWVGLFAVPQLFLASWLLEADHAEVLADADWRGWGAVAFSAVGASIVAHGLLYYLLAKYPVYRVVPLMLLAPVLAVFLAVWILGEPLTWRIMIGGLITITGVGVVQLLPARQGRTEVPAP